MHNSISTFLAIILLFLLSACTAPYGYFPNPKDNLPTSGIDRDLDTTSNPIWYHRNSTGGNWIEIKTSDLNASGEFIVQFARTDIAVQSNTPTATVFYEIQGQGDDSTVRNPGINSPFATVQSVILSISNNITTNEETDSLRFLNNNKSITLRAIATAPQQNSSGYIDLKIRGKDSGRPSAKLHPSNQENTEYPISILNGTLSFELQNNETAYYTIDFAKDNEDAPTLASLAEPQTSNNDHKYSGSIDISRSTRTLDTTNNTLGGEPINSQLRVYIKTRIRRSDGSESVNVEEFTYILVP